MYFDIKGARGAEIHAVLVLFVLRPTGAKALRRRNHWGSPLRRQRSAATQTKSGATTRYGSPEPATLRSRIMTVSLDGEDPPLSPLSWS